MTTKASIVVLVVFICAIQATAAIPASVKLIPNLAYVENGDPAQKLDIYVPAKPDPNLRPLIVWIHGGGWNGGNKSGIPFLWLVDQGYVVASLEYRFSRKALFPAQIQDCQAAIRWLRAHANDYHIDPSHIGVVGESAGGHLALMLGVTGGKDAFAKVGGNQDQSDRVQAVCDLYGPADFTDVMDQAAHAAVPSKFTWNKGDPYSKLIGVLLGSDRAKTDAVSPVHYVTPDVAPMLILQGTHDPLVPPAQSQEMYDRLKAAGVDAWLQHFINAGHGGRIFHTAPVHQMELAFFGRYLKGQKTIIALIPDSQVTVVATADAATTQPHLSTTNPVRP